jgi:putative NIF3 family GTP cyclohydrolase 1 type 2
MKIKEIIHEIENFAPLKFQESYDNSGIQVGDSNRDVHGVLLCVDVTEAVLEEAIEKNCNLIISHHPLIFSGIKKIIPDNNIGKIIFKAIENHITI